MSVSAKLLFNLKFGERQSHTGKWGDTTRKKPFEINVDIPIYIYIYR